MKWTTFKGEEADTETATHQHLSNYIWYSRLSSISEIYLISHTKALQERFGGELLLYKPEIEFEEEMQFLMDKGYLYVCPTNQTWYIIKESTIIGEILVPEEQFKETLKEWRDND